ncbi:putative GlcNAc transferase [Listeria fleischmannii 1991]|uniref:D-inositol-3-phosphate glycosyltransferase n=2 Tax=Listeria fleischmannii TaxID=1069827 RepID=A0A2X3HIZ1_9LIST|nr:glycosyltransferase family 4 protein [Listeria fleischmannii]EMG29308.1 putative GlcNAc transferase [Listeria fleischmannii subsp. fleischmannii LU2006-1]KMT59158.1 putative GlcNAc transferase [Listeria fleischmannii 1991]SQC72201.1 D-inositol-3-phosphate glycosyltransferase [Listeria fleischmannii subsp. fleischmannii]
MKILVIANMFPSKEYPSYGIFVKNHIHILEKAAKTVDTITMKKEISRFKKMMTYLNFYWQILVTLLFKQHDLIYLHYASHSALPILFAKLLNPRINLTVNLHGSDVFPETSIQKRLQKWVERLLKEANHVVVPSDYFKKVVVKRYNLKADNILISPSGGVNRNLFAPKEKRPNNNSMCVGYVGRIDIDKGWDDALYGFAEFKREVTGSVQLIMVGSGKENKQKEALIKELGIEASVTCYDLLPQEELVALYNEMDVLLFPSRRKGESLGLVGLEAMACGTPVIGSEIAGIKGYLIDGQNGYFTEAGNPSTIAHKLIQFERTSFEERQKLRQNALHTAIPYDEKIVQDNMIELLPRLTKKLRLEANSDFHR